jgi:PKD repeat protein
MSRRARIGGVLLIVLALALAGCSGPLLAQPAGPSRSAATVSPSPRDSPAPGVASPVTGAPSEAVARPAAAPTLSVAGASPSAIVLIWTESDSFGFTGYSITESTANASGPWQSVGSVAAKATTTWSTGSLTPGAPVWWQVTADSYLGDSASNVVEYTQPALASLNYTLPTGSSAEFNWTNNATYGGGLEFVSYAVDEEVGGGAPSLIASVPTESALNFTVTGLSGGLGYTFFVVTTDCYVGCGSGSPSDAVTDSNAVTLGVAVPLASSLSVVRPVIDTGQFDLFTCNVAGGVAPYSFTWDFGNGTPAAGPQSESVSYSTPGTPTIDCTATDGAHVEASSATSVLVNAAPILTVSASPVAVDVNESTTLNCTPSLGTPSFTVSWALGDGVVAPGTSVSHAYALPGTVVVTCTVTDATTTTVDQSLSVAVSPRLSLVATSSAPLVAPGTAVSLTADAANGSGTYSRFAWTFSGGGTATGASVSHSFSSPGPQTATVVVTDSNGATNRTEVAVDVAPITVTLTNSPTSGTTGELLTFNASASGGAGGPFNYSWNFGDGTAGYGAVVEHRYSSSGSFDPSVRVTDRLGASNSSAPARVAVSAPPPAPPLVPLWALLLLLLVIVAVVGAVAYREFRRRRSAALEKAAPWAPPTDPSRTMVGRKSCPACGASNLPIRESCESCGASLPRRSLRS